MLKMSSLAAPLALLAVIHASAASFDVKTYGARGDGRTLDTAAINRAIDAAAVAGGGTVEFPAGTYLSYSIHLRSNVTLYLGPGATLRAAEPSADLTHGYDAPEVNPADLYEDFGHSHWHNSLIWGEDLEHVGITGPGRIDGYGLSRGTGGTRRDPLPGEAKNPALAFPEAVRAQIAAIVPGPFGYPGGDTLPSGVGNKAIALKNCRDVVLRDLTIFHGGHFGVLVTGVDNLLLDHLTIDTNRDGVDIDCCRNVRMTNCTVNSPHDDGICPKSSFALGYRRMTENVTISDCQVTGYVEGTLLDGRYIPYPTEASGRTAIGHIKMGTESNGGFRNITITNCVVEYSHGLALQAVDGAIIEDIAISNITMRHIYDSPIFIRLGRRLRGPKGTEVGAIRRVKIDNIVVSDAGSGVGGGIMIAGGPGHPIEGVALTNIFVDYQGGGTAADAARIAPEDERGHYPDPTQFGVLPAWGLFARHVKNLSVAGVEFRLQKPDARPPLWLEDAAAVSLTRLKSPVPASGPAIVQKAVTGLAVHESPGFENGKNTGEAR
jgi:polygalacturonase